MHGFKGRLVLGLGLLAFDREHTREARGVLNSPRLLETVTANRRVLVLDNGEIAVGVDAILVLLDQRFREPPGAEHRQRAAEKTSDD